jgi:quercetin dioxygenase-like cupin family protein
MMKLSRPTLASLGIALLAAAVTTACSDGASSTLTAQSPRTPRSGAAHSEGAQHAMGNSDDLNWGPAPAIFPPGAVFAVVQGDPSVAGEIFTVRLRFPDGYILPPHTHPTDEHVTVLRGTFGVGLGTVFSADGLTLLQPNGFITAPKDMAHFATARGITEVQVHAIGPFQLTYVNPADDPTKK